MKKLFSISFADEHLACSLAEYTRNVFPELETVHALKVGDYWEVHGEGEFTRDMFNTIGKCGARIWDVNNMSPSLTID